MTAVEQRQQREVEEENRQLAEQLSQATCAKLAANIRQDIEVLKGHMPTKEAEALEHSLDAKYLKDRQLPLANHFC